MSHTHTHTHTHTHMLTHTYILRLESNELNWTSLWQVITLKYISTMFTHYKNISYILHTIDIFPYFYFLD